MSEGTAAEFIGFEKPTRDINAPRWIERLRALSTQYEGSWAKYGPYNRMNGANRALHTVHKAFSDNGTLFERQELDTHIQPDEDNFYYLYIRIFKSGLPITK